MIPQHITLNQSPSTDPQPTIQHQETETTAPKFQEQTPERANDFSDQIISQDDFYKLYDNDTKVAADAVIDDDGNISIDTSLKGDEQAPALTDQEALENTEMLMTLREAVQSVGISLYVDGTWKGAEQYEYPEPQFKKLVKAWAPLVQRAGLRVSPWWQVAVTEFTCTGPLAVLAHNNRKQRLELEESRRIIKAQNEKINKLEKQPVSSPSGRSPASQKKWAVDKNGHFTHTPAGVYIDVTDRKDKPNLVDDYNLLCKHNGKENIDRIFNL